MNKWLKWIIVGFILSLVTGILIWLGYQVDWTGFNYRLDIKDQLPGKYLWDWMELLIIPIVGGSIALFFNYSQRKNELTIAEKVRQTDRSIAVDKQKQEILQVYIDRMTDLLINHKLRLADRNNETAIAARSQTLTILDILDGYRKRSVIQFLSEAKLIELNPIIRLSHANLSKANLSRIKLQNCNFKRANMMGAKMRFSSFSGSNLSYANLKSANLYRASMVNSDLAYAQLDGAYLHRTNLALSNLEMTNLQKANLTNAFLQKVNLQRAKLREADLSEIDLSEARLYYADCKFTVMVKANLTGADLRGADLTGADLTDAKLTGADLSLANLHNAKISPSQLKYAKSLALTILPDDMDSNSITD